MNWTSVSRGVALALLLLASSDLHAQQAVVTQPGKANSGEASSTIVASDVFQLVWASHAQPNGASTNGPRSGCLVVNNSTHTQWVYFQGPGMTTPTAGNSSTLEAVSIPLTAAGLANTAGGNVSCATGAGQTLQDAVWIAGTMGDTYVAKQQ